MIHEESPLACAWVTVFAVGLAAFGTEGCAAGDGDDVSATNQALYSEAIAVYYNDNRAAASFNIRIDATEQNSGLFFTSDASVPGGMVPGGGVDVMYWSQNGLYQSWQAQPFSSGWTYISDNSSSQYRFTTMRVTVTATINGSCHTDSEYIVLGAWPPYSLAFDGRGASWNGTCWVGNNLLRKQYE